MADDTRSSHRKKVGIVLAVALLAAIAGFVLAVKFPGTHHDGDDSIAGVVAAIAGSLAAIAAAVARRREDRKDG